MTEYDNNGKEIFKSRYDLLNKLEWIQKYKYNENGLNINITYDSPNGQKIREYTYEYNNKKKIQEKVVDENGIKYYKYNDYTDVIEYKENEDIYRYDYTYDKKGNWTKIIEYRNTIPILIKERNITYYIALKQNAKK